MYSGLEVDQDGPGDVPCVVALVVEDILAIAALGRKVLEVSVLADAVLLAKLLPELTADFAWLSHGRSVPKLTRPGKN